MSKRVRQAVSFLFPELLLAVFTAICLWFYFVPYASHAHRKMCRETILWWEQLLQPPPIVSEEPPSEDRQ